MRHVFVTFLRLGLTSFGGPIAHLGYFRREFVERQRWLDARLFAQIVAFCSILPGPTSSQVGMIVGLLRGGPAGAFAAWLGFTLPSAVALAVAGLLLTSVEAATPDSTWPWLAGFLAGVSAAATAIVAQAVLAMAKAQCPDPPTQTIAAGAAALAIALASVAGWQWAPIAAGAVAGALLLRRADREQSSQTPPGVALPKLPRSVSIAAAILFVALAGLAAAAAQRSPAGVFAATIVRAGSLVFGGGHVVLPLLQSLVPSGLVSARDFYAGYGLTQAVPGPLFAFAAFLGSANGSRLHGVAGAFIATGLIFLPSFLLVFALLPGFAVLQANRRAAAALRGANAAVVGLLGALLYSPLLTQLGSSVWLPALALAAFAAVTAWKVAPWVTVLGAGVAGALAAQIGLKL